MDPTTIDYLAAVCKIWGAVKFYHPWLAYKDIDWDQALLNALPSARAACTDDDARTAIGQMLEALDDQMTRVCDDANAGVLLDELVNPASPQGEPVSKQGNVVVVRAAAFGEDLVECANKLRETFEGATGSGGMVLDLRGMKWAFANALRAKIGLVLSSDVYFPGERRRMHSGYKPQGGGSSGGYFSGWVLADADRIGAKSSNSEQIAIAVIADATKPAECLWAAVLQRSIYARAVVVGRAKPEITHAEQVVFGGFRANIRVAEAVWSRGSSDFDADWTVDPSDADETNEYLVTVPVRTAISLLGSGADEKTPATTPSFVSAPSTESFDAAAGYPDADARLLALFRFWNIIDRFYPYHHVLERAWEETLVEFLPRFDAASNAMEYHVAVAEMATRTQDTHTSVQSDVLRTYVGESRPDLAVRTIEGQTVVVYAGAATSPINVGDVVRIVDDVPIEQRREELARISSASTPQALDWRVDRLALCGPAGEMTLELEEGSGARKLANVQRNQNLLPWPVTPSKLPVFGILPAGYGYFDLAGLAPWQVDEAFEFVRETRGLIIDIRNYPIGTAWSIAPRLARERVKASDFRRPETRDPSREWDAVLSGAQYIEPSGWRYDGTVVCLIDERAVSQSEHTCLYLESATDVTFIGGPTNGANGDVTNFPLPGGIWIAFGGHDVRHADGRQLQRVGIQPHIAVRPTLAGVRAGRDEVLEAAIAYLDRNSGG